MSNQMADHRTTRSAAEGGFVGSWEMLASVFMIFGGVMAVFQGIAAIADDDVFAVTTNYVFAFDLTAWGWIHLILGLVVVLAGFALLKDAMWARIVGVLLAGLGMIANFVWLPYAPIWAVSLIAINGFVIWALCTPRASRS